MGFMFEHNQMPAQDFREWRHHMTNSCSEWTWLPYTLSQVSDWQEPNFPRVSHYLTYAHIVPTEDRHP